MAGGGGSSRERLDGRPLTWRHGKGAGAAWEYLFLGAVTALRTWAGRGKAHGISGAAFQVLINHEYFFWIVLLDSLASYPNRPWTDGTQVECVGTECPAVGESSPAGQPRGHWVWSGVCPQAEGHLDKPWPPDGFLWADSVGSMSSLPGRTLLSTQSSSSL